MGAFSSLKMSKQTGKTNKQINTPKNTPKVKQINSTINSNRAFYRSTRMGAHLGRGMKRKRL